MRSIRLLILFSLLMAVINPAFTQQDPAVNELTPELVTARIQTLRDAGATEGDDSVVRSYEQVANWLAETEVHTAAEKNYLDALNSAPQLEAEIRLRMESNDYTAAGLDSTSVSRLSRSQVENKLTELRVQLNDTIESKEALDRRIATEQSGAPTVQARLEAISQRLQDLPATVITIEPNIQPSQLEVSQWLVVAERAALVAERRALEARLTSQPMRYSRRKAESDEFALVISGLQSGIELLEAELATHEETEDTESGVSLDEDSPAYGLVQQLIEDRTQLRNQRDELAEILKKLKEQEDQTRQTQQSLDESYKAVQQIVSMSENSASLGHVLMAHWYQADQYRIALTDDGFGGEIGEHVIRRTEYEEALSGLANPADFLAESLSTDSEGLSPELDEETLEAVRNLLRSKRELLTELIANETDLITVKGSIDRSIQQLDALFGEYQRYLGSRILWAPSHPPISFSSLANLDDEFQDLVSRLSEIKFRAPSLQVSLLLFLALFALLFRKRVEAKLHNLNQSVGRPRDDSIRFTAGALLINLAAGLVLPVLLMILASMLQFSDVGSATYLAHAVLGSAVSLFILLFMRQACDEDGVARAHFNWSQETCESIRRLTSIALIWWWPVLFISALLIRVEMDSINAVFGRLLFSTAFVALCLALLSFLHSQQTRLWLNPRIRLSLATILATAALFLAVMTAIGYVYTVAVFYKGFRESVMIVIGLIFFYYFMQRWLLVVRRRLRFNELLAARQSPQDGESQPEDSAEFDLVTLGASVQQLLKAGTLLIGAVAFAFLWSPLFEALEAMQRVTLWTVSDVSEGEAIITGITLASLALAVLYGVITYLAARYVPDLVALLLRSRKNFSTGSLYATVKLLGYLIVGIGVITILSTLGLRWDRLQWLVAALGVGIGFGLQEIIANFICGLVILFERPIRVGDLVTVGESSGQVVRITIRATTIRDFDGKELLVPNKEFITGRLLNWTLSNTDIRMTLEVGIAYGSDVDKAIAIIEGLLESHEMVLAKPEPDVLFREFGDSSLVLIARYFFDDIENRGFLLSDLHRKIYAAFAEAGIVIAFPQIDVHFDPKPDELPPLPQS